MYTATDGRRLADAAKPLMDWLTKFGTPQAKVIVERGRAEVVVGELCVTPRECSPPRQLPIKFSADDGPMITGGRDE